MASLPYEAGMVLSQANPTWMFTLWLTFQRHRRGEIGALARFVDKEAHLWPSRRDRKGLVAYLQERNSAMLPNFEEAWQEYEKAITEGREY